MQARGPRMRTKDAVDDLGDEVLRHLQQLFVGSSALRRITHCAILARLCAPSEPPNEASLRLASAASGTRRRSSTEAYGFFGANEAIGVRIRRRMVLGQPTSERRLEPPLAGLQ